MMRQSFPYTQHNVTAAVVDAGGTVNIANGTYTPLNEVKSKAPACCEEIIDKLLAKGVSKRFQTAAQIVKQLDECLDQIR